MNMINFRRYISIFMCLFFAWSMPTLAEEVDSITDFKVQEKIGTEEDPHLFATINVKKQRDLQIVVRDIASNDVIKTSTRRIKKSGTYNMKYPVKNLKAGNKYRVELYLTPRKKKWADRVTQPVRLNMEVVDVPKYVKKTNFSNNDKINNVNWPKVITDNGETVLKINFNITEPRQLHVILSNKENWKEMGKLVSVEKKPGAKSYPITDMVKNFGPGKYAWMVYLTELGSEEPLGKKQGKHFEIKAE